MPMMSCKIHAQGWSWLRSQTRTVRTALATLGTDTAFTVPKTGMSTSCEYDVKSDSYTAKKSAVMPCIAAKQNTHLIMMNTQCCIS